MEILFVIVVAYLIVYRTGVGTWCAITGKQTPWERAREARAAKAEGRPANPLRTARGFLGRLYGDMWEDLNNWLDETRARKRNGERRRTLREWFGDLFNAGRGMFQRDREDLAPDEDESVMVGETVRPPDMPTMTGSDPGTTEPASKSRPEPARVAPHIPLGYVPPSPESTAALAEEPGIAPVSQRPRDAHHELGAFEGDPDRTALRAQLEDGNNRAADGEREQLPPGMSWLNPNARIPDVATIPTAADTELADQTSTADTTSPSVDAPAVRPHLSLVPTGPQTPAPALVAPHPIEKGAQNMVNTVTGERMDLGGSTTGGAPEVDEAASVQSVDGFADQVVEHGNIKWPETLEAARINISNAGLSGDPEISGAVGEIEEAAQTMAAAGARLKSAMAKHVELAEHVSDTAHHGTKIGAYENQ